MRTGKSRISISSILETHSELSGQENTLRTTRVDEEVSIYDAELEASRYRIDEFVWISNSNEIDQQKFMVGKISGIKLSGEASKIHVDAFPGVFVVESVDELNSMTALKVKSLELPPNQVCQLDETELRDDNGFENMVDMPRLTHASVLMNLRKRYLRRLIYTSIGDILVSVNPFEDVSKELYGEDQLAKYNAFVDQALENKAPHVFNVAKMAYSSLFREKVNQSILISGDSGSGKTEATKLILKYLVNSSGTGDSIEKKLLEANPILEAFGNAKTLRNDNSSRFGRWTGVLFDKNSGKIVGGRFISYLLEENRVIRHSEGERTFHILYQIANAYPVSLSCSDLDADEKYELNPSEFSYFQHRNSHITGVDDVKGFEVTVDALQTSGFSKDLIRQILKLLRGILFIGNIEFEENENSNSVVKDNFYSSTAARLLGIDQDSFYEALCNRSLKISMAGKKKQNIMVPLDSNAATDCRDALSMKIYQKIFDWLIEFLNTEINCESPIELHELLSDEIMHGFSNIRMVGVLDIFGFEVFEENGLEQFLINYANEVLQQHFISTVFKLEETLYLEEQVDVSEVKFVDNAACLDLLHSKPNGIIHLLNDELSMPKSSHSTFLTNLKAKWKSGHSNLSYAKIASLSTFSVSHYAGCVTYDARDFLEKSRSKINDNLLEIFITTSKLEIVRRIFNQEYEAFTAEDDKISPYKENGTENLYGGTWKTPSEIKHSKYASKDSNMVRTITSKQPAYNMGKKPTLSTMRLGMGTLSGSLKYSLSLTSSAKVSSIGLQFKLQLASLMRMISLTHSHFIRCIKPNMDKLPKKFEQSKVLDQLRNSGLLETILARKNGYPERFTFAEFFFRYHVLYSKKNDATHRKTHSRMLSSAAHSKNSSRGSSVMGRSMNDGLTSSRTRISSRIRRGSIDSGKQSNLEVKMKETCISIMMAFELENKEIKDIDKLWRLGLTKIFLKPELVSHLEAQVRRLITTHVIVFQKYTRGYLCRKRVKDYKNLVMKFLKCIEAIEKNESLEGIQNGNEIIAIDNQSIIPKYMLERFQKSGQTLVESKCAVMKEFSSEQSFKSIEDKLAFLKSKVVFDDYGIDAISKIKIEIEGYIRRLESINQQLSEFPMMAKNSRSQFSEFKTFLMVDLASLKTDDFETFSEYQSAKSQFESLSKFFLDFDQLVEKTDDTSKQNKIYSSMIVKDIENLLERGVELGISDDSKEIRKLNELVSMISIAQTKEDADTNEMQVIERKAVQEKQIKFSPKTKSVDKNAKSSIPSDSKFTHKSQELPDLLMSRASIKTKRRAPKKANIGKSETLKIFHSSQNSIASPNELNSITEERHSNWRKSIKSLFVNSKQNGISKQISNQSDENADSRKIPASSKISGSISPMKEKSEPKTAMDPPTKQATSPSHKSKNDTSAEKSFVKPTSKKPAIVSSGNKSAFEFFKRIEMNSADSSQSADKQPVTSKKRASNFDGMKASTQDQEKEISSSHPIRRHSNTKHFGHPQSNSVKFNEGKASEEGPSGIKLMWKAKMKDNDSTVSNLGSLKTTGNTENSTDEKNSETSLRRYNHRKFATTNSRRTMSPEIGSVRKSVKELIEAQNALTSTHMPDTNSDLYQKKRPNSIKKDIQNSEEVKFDRRKSFGQVMQGKFPSKASGSAIKSIEEKFGATESSNGNLTKTALYRNKSTELEKSEGFVATRRKSRPDQKNVEQRRRSRLQDLFSGKE